MFRFWRPIVTSWRRRPKTLVCAWFNPSRHLSGKGRSFWLWHPWGHDVQKWGGCSSGAPLTVQRCLDDAMECRSTWRTGCLPVEGPASRIGWKLLEQGAETVRKLLRSDWVECRLSLAPPISMNPVLVSWPAKTMSMKAHCLIQCDSLKVQLACLILR